MKKEGDREAHPAPTRSPPPLINKPASLTLHTGAASRPDWPDRVRAYAADISAQMAMPPDGSGGGDDDDAADDADAVAAARAGSG